MKVYAVSMYTGDGYEVAGVYDSMAKAEAARESFKESIDDIYVISEWEVQ